MSSVAKGLSDKQDHDVDFGKKKHKVKVTPFLNGEISQMKVRRIKYVAIISTVYDVN